MKRIFTVISLCVLWAMAVQAQETISGTVVDGKNEPLPGARVEVVGRSEYAITDIDGTFVIELPVTASKVKVSYPGLPTREAKIKPDMVVKLGKGWSSNAKGYRAFWDFYGGFGFGGKVNVEAGLSQINDIKNFLAFGFGMTHGYQINQHLFVGVGVSLMANALSATESQPYYGYQESNYVYMGQDNYKRIEMSNITFPIYADVRWDFGLTEKTAPYIGVKLGYQISLEPNNYEEDEDWGYGIFDCYSWKQGYSSYLNVFPHDVNGFFFQPSIGMRTTLKGKRSFNIGLSYNVMFPKKLSATYEYYDESGSYMERKDLGVSRGGVLMLNFGFDW